MRNLLYIFLCTFMTMAHGQITDRDVERQNFEPKNIMINGGAEAGIRGYDVTGSAVIGISISATDVSFGGRAFTFDPSAASENFRSDLTDLPRGLVGQNCLARMRYVASDGDYVWKILDGGANILASKTLSANSAPPRLETLTFICGTNATIRMIIESNSDADVITMDDFYIGENFLVGTGSQAEEVGTIHWESTTNCIWSRTSTSFGDFVADADCSAPTVTGSISSPSTKIPAANIALPPGKYLFAISAMFNNFGQSAECRISNTGSTIVSLPQPIPATTDARAHGVMLANFEVSTAQASDDYNIQCRIASGNIDIVNSADFRDLMIRVYRYPTSTDTIFRADVFPWRVDVNIGGANPALGTSNQATYIPINNSGLDMVINPGSIAVEIPCSSTNPPTGLTCAAGNEAVGVSFDLPVAGDIQICGEFSHEMSGNAAGNGKVTFQWIETPNSAETILSEGNSRIVTGNDVSTSDADRAITPLHVCGIFRFTSKGQKTIRLFYEQTITATISTNQLKSDRGATFGQNDIHITVMSLTQSIPMPQIVNSVHSTSSGQVRLVSAFINNNSGTPEVQAQDGLWIDSITDNGVGNYTLNFTLSTFSVAPNCTANLGVDIVDDGSVVFNNVLSTSVDVVLRDSADTPRDNDFMITCVGEK